MKLALLVVGIYAIALLKCWLLARFGGSRRPLMAAMVPLIALDCLGNLLHGGSWRNTLSGEAWHHRQHRWWGWTHRFIDALFLPLDGPDHCRRQAEREALYGSVWAAWGASWRAA